MSTYSDIMSMTEASRAELLDSLSPIAKTELESRYRKSLRDCHGETVQIAGLEYDTAETFQLIDPTEYRAGFAAYLGWDGSVIDVAGVYYSTDDIDEAYSRLAGAPGERAAKEPWTVRIERSVAVRKA